MICQEDGMVAIFLWQRVMKDNNRVLPQCS